MVDDPEPLRVLLVEDDDDAVLLTHALQRAGFAPEFHRVDTAVALREALRRPWDLVLSDFEMPAFDGLEAFAIVHEHDPEIPFVFVSGTLGEERAVAAMRAGARGRGTICSRARSIASASRCAASCGPAPNGPRGAKPTLGRRSTSGG